MKYSFNNNLIKGIIALYILYILYCIYSILYLVLYIPRVMTTLFSMVMMTCYFRYDIIKLKLIIPFNLIKKLIYLITI